MLRRISLQLKQIFRNFYDLGYMPYGFEFFTPFHFTVLAIIILVGVYLYKPYKNSIKVRRTLKAIPLIIELIRLFFVYDTPYYDPSYLPFHMCIWGTYFLVLDIFLYRNRFIRSTLFFLFMPGALAALIFPAWGELNKFSYVSIISWIIHSILVYIPVYFVLNHEYKPRFTDIFNPLIFCTILTPFIKWLNKTLDANYFFMNEPSEGSPLVAIYKYFPNYLLGLFLAAFVVMVAIFLIYKILEKIFRRR